MTRIFGTLRDATLNRLARRIRSGMPRRRIARWVAISAVMAMTHAAFAQENPVYVDDSPQGWELFRQAQDQVRANAGEAVRLYQELLDDFSYKLIPVGPSAPDQFRAVRQRVLRELQNNPALLERYRVIQQAMAEQLLQADDLYTLVRTRSLTEAGLEALLRLAQRDLEQGRFQNASRWLVEAGTHPDLNRGTTKRTAHFHYMTAVAALYSGDAPRVDAALQALASLGAEAQPLRDAVDSLRHTLASITRPPSPVSTFDIGRPAELNDLVAQAIWTQRLDDSLAQRRATQQDDQPLGTQANAALLEQRLRNADFTTTVATAAGEYVYINEGHTIRALHRLTGAMLWIYRNLNRISLTDREVTAALDVNGIAVAPGAGGAPGFVVTLTGHAQPNSRSESGRVLCLNAQNGERVWSAEFSKLVDAPANEQLFPHGMPIVAEGTVFVAARRVTTQSISSAYVVALDLESGSVKWTRQVTSSGGLRAGIRPFDSIVYDGASIYMSSAIGALARLNPADGEILWLYRFNAPINVGLADQMRRPWELGGPVVTPRGVLAIQPDQRRVVLIDAESGGMLESYPLSSASEWGQPRYLLADGEFVYAIGAEIRTFDLEHLEGTAWRLPAPERSSISRPPGASGQPQPLSAVHSLELRGRVQVVQGTLIAPSAEGVLIIDSRTGELRNRLPVQHVGNPLAVDAQLLLASGDRLDAYMSFETAERMLRDRSAQSPGDVGPALSLLRLSMRVRNLSLALEATAMTLDSLDRVAAVTPTEAEAKLASREELLNLLLELASSGITSTVAEGELLYAAMGSAATEPSQRVEYLLSYAQWLTTHALDRAVESYQTILSNRSLAEVWRREDGVMRPASAWVRERMHALFAERGLNVYAAQADFAALRLRQLNSGNVDPATLSALAAEFPFAEAAIESARKAADAFEQRGDDRAALGVLLTTYRSSPLPSAAEKLLSRAHAVADRAGWRVQAEAIARLARMNHLPAASQSWLSSTPAEAIASKRLPVVGTQCQQAQPLGGPLLDWFSSSSIASAFAERGPADRALFRIGSTIRMMRSNGMDEHWSATIDGDVPQLLRVSDRDIVLWLKADPQDPKAIRINAADGTVQWTTPRISDLLGDPVRELGRSRTVREQMPDGEPFDPMQTLPLMASDAIIVVQRIGGMVALDLQDGKTVRWVSKVGANGFEQVHSVALHDHAIVIAGMSRDLSAGGQMMPRVAAFDSRTGQALAGYDSANPSNPMIPLTRVTGVKWMRVSPIGLLVVGTTQGLHAVDLHSGQRLWSNLHQAVADSQRAWVFDDRMILEDSRSRLRTVNLEDGSASEPFETPLRGEWDPLELRSVMVIDPASGSAAAPDHAGAGDAGGITRVIAHYPQRVVLYDGASGAVVGADVISDERDYRWLWPAQDRLVLVSSRSSQIPIADQAGRRAQIWSYFIYILSGNGKVLSAPYRLTEMTERVTQTTVIDGWLLLSTATQTLAVPMNDE